MGQAFDAIIDQSDSSDLLSTNEVAKLLGVSRQHVVDLCDRGDLAFVMVGTHRRIRREDAERARQVRTKMTRDQRRSLWLSYAVAGRIAADPQPAVERAQRYLGDPETHSNKWTREWEKLLESDVEEVLKALTSTSQRSRELRQNSPFMDAIDQQERERVLDSFTSNWRRHASS